MTAEIPAWAVREARQTFHEAISGPAGDEVATFARALVKERERAARIASEAADECDGAEGWLIGPDIADAILADDGGGK